MEEIKMAKRFMYSDIANNSEFRGFLFTSIIDKISRYGRSGSMVNIDTFDSPIRRGLM